MNHRIGLMIVAVGFACAAGMAEEARFWAPYAPGPNTVALFHFDGDVRDASVCSNAAALEGAAELAADGGRFGGALRLGGGGLTVTLTRPLAAFVLELWINPQRLPPPGKQAVLLDRGYQPGRQQWLQLLLHSDGSVLWKHSRAGGRLGHGDSMALSKPGAVKAGQWQHLAVRVLDSAEAMASRIYVDGRNVSVPPHVNPLAFPAAGPPGTLTLGMKQPAAANREDWYDLGTQHVARLRYRADAFVPYVGLVDEFRVTAQAMEIPPLPDTSFLDPEKRRPLPEAETPAAGNLLFYASFDATTDAERAAGGGKAWSAQPVPLVPGVRGTAAALDGRTTGPLRFPARGNLAPAAGTVSFWVRPHDTLRWPGTMLTAPCGMFSPFILLRSVYQHHEPLYPTRDLFPVEQWVHVAWVWNRYTATLYVNGAEAYATPMAMRFLHEPPAAEGGLELGMAGAADFDEVRIYGRPLSPAELAREHGRYRPGARPLRVGAAGAMVCDFRGPNRLAGSVFACSGTVANAAGCDIVLKKGARAVAGTFLRVGGEGETPFIWDLPPAVSSGTFQLGIAFRDGEGKLLLSGEQTLERAAYPWLNNAVGLDDRVLHPWTPVQAKGRQISVVGRDFTLGDGGLFSAIRNWGHDLLAAPMRLEMATRRGPGEFAGGRAAVTVRKPGSVAWSGEGSFAWGTARRLAVRVDGRLEYDGAARLALEFDPGVDPVEVSALALVIPVSAAYAELCSWMIGSFMHLAVQVPTPDYGPFGSELSRRDGEVFSSKALYEAYFPGNIVQSGIGRFRLPTVGNYLPQVWFGNNEGGLSIFGDNDQGWVPTNDAPAIQVVRRGHTADIRLNFIAAPHWLDRRRTVVLGLLPTPVKPLPADWRRVSYHPDSWAPWASSTTYLADPEDERQNLADLKARVAEIHRKGRKSAPHINGAFFEAGPRTRRAFAAEWHDANAYAPYGMFSASKCDFMAWTYAFWKREIGIDGVYFDCATPEPNFNILSGTAYRLEDGRVQPGWTIWNERALFKRAAHVFGDLYRANYAWGNGFNHPEISGWLPSLVMGEGCEITTRDNRELVGRWLRGVPGHDMHPLRYYSETIPGTFGLERLQGISHPWGIIRLWQFPHFRLFETPAWTNDSPEAVRQVQTFSRSALSQILLLDTQPEWCGRFPGWYTNFTGRADLTFYGFWNNGELLARTPADVRVNAYVAGRDLLVIASNPGMEKTPVTVTADLAGLGLAPAAGKPAAVVDAEAGATWGRNVVDVYAKHLWDGPTLLPEAERAVKADTAGGKVTLAFAVNPQDYRAFRVTVP